MANEINSNGLNSFKLNMQGGSPVGYGASKCLNLGFNPDGSLVKPITSKDSSRFLWTGTLISNERKRFSIR